MKWSLTILLLTCCLKPVRAQDSQELVSVPEETIQKLLIHRVKPVLPAELEALTPGKVVFDAAINKAGQIESLQTVSGHPMLARVAVEAVKQWKYRRYEVNGIPRDVETTVHVEFSDAMEERTETHAKRVESPVLLTPEDVPAQSVFRVAPNYPPLARQARIQGTVILRIIISKVGGVREMELVSGHPMLSPAAMDAVKKWRYIPYESDGVTVEFQTDVQVIFKLAGA